MERWLICTSLKQVVEFAACRLACVLSLANSIFFSSYASPFSFVARVFSKDMSLLRDCTCNDSKQSPAFACQYSYKDNVKFCTLKIPISELLFTYGEASRARQVVLVANMNFANSNLNMFNHSCEERAEKPLLEVLSIVPGGSITSIFLNSF